MTNVRKRMPPRKRTIVKETLELSGKEIPKIPTNHVQKAAKYDVVKLSNNPGLQIRDIGKFESTVELHVSACDLENLPDELGHLKLIQRLDLQKNSTLHAFPEVVLHLTALKELDLGYCHISSIPKKIKCLSKLERLILDGNRELRDICSEVFCLPALRELGLAECGLTSIPDEIEQLQQLEKFCLQGNTRLENISGAICKLKSLKTFLIGHCGLSAIPEDVKELAQLEELRIQENKELLKVPLGVFHCCKRLKILDLSYCGISEIPNDIRQLQHLEVLVLSGNEKLESLPDDVYQLPNLKELIASNCNLRGISDLTGQLRKLEKLCLHGNKIGKIPEGLVSLPELTYLDMSNCNIASIPFTMEQLPKLKYLNLLDNPDIKELPKSIGLLSTLTLEELHIGSLYPGCSVKLSKLLHFGISSPKKPRRSCRNTRMTSEGPSAFHRVRVLHMPRCDSRLIHKLPDIPDLQTLTSIDFTACELTCLPFRLNQSGQFSTVELASNKLTQEGLKNIFKLRNLTELGISDCGLHEIPDTIVNLKKLKKLDLHKNQIKIISRSLLRLEKLQELNISGCGLSALPSEISELKRLTFLNVSKNQLNELPARVSALSQLQQLDISDNESIDTFPDVVTELKKMRKLNISGCPIRTLPTALEKLTDLEVLEAQDCALQSYPEVAKKLMCLKRLDLSNTRQSSKSKNCIKDIPTDLVDSALHDLLLRGNPILSPLDTVCQEGMPAIRRYLRRIVKEGAHRVSPETISTVGDSGAGKTSIVQSLKFRMPRAASADDRTCVVDQHIIELGHETLVNINDFGGHDIYRSVLKTFLPPEGIAILAYDISGKDDVAKMVGEWMATLLTISPYMRIVAVGTHGDLLHREDRSRVKLEVQNTIDQTIKEAIEDCEGDVVDLRRERKTMKSRGQWDSHANIEEKIASAERKLDYLKSSKCPHIVLSCTEGGEAGLQDLFEVISGIVQAPESMPASWYQVMQDILHPQNRLAELYITWDDAEKIARDRLNGEYSDKDLKRILRYLASTSQILWYEKHSTLGNCIFHKVDDVLQVCKCVLHHDVDKFIAGQRRTTLPKTKGHARKYKEGFLIDEFLTDLLPDHSAEDINVIRELMLKLQLISKASDGKSSDTFIMPSLLNETKTDDVLKLESKQQHFDPKVAVQLHFSSSVVPSGLFETSFEAVLSHLCGKGIKCFCWRRGIHFRADQVTVAYTKDCGGFLEVAATSSTVNNVWNIMHPFLNIVTDHVLKSCKGPSPQCMFVCPGCRCSDSRAENLFDAVRLEHLMDNEQSHLKHGYCHVCENDIPRALMFTCSPDSVTESDIINVEKFFDKLRSKCPVFRQSSIDGKPPNVLKRKFRQAREILVEELDTTVVNFIIDALYGRSLINTEDKEEFSAEKTRTKKARFLCDLIDGKEEKAAEVVLELFESQEVNRKDLAIQINSYQT